MNNARPYIIWIVATLFVVYAFSLNTAAGVFANSIKNTLQASNLGVSLATGAFILGFACMQLPGGYLLDHYNAKFVVSAGILILAIGNILISYSSNLGLYTASNFIQGVGASFAFIAAAVLISQWFSTRSFPIVFGLTQTLACVFAGILHYYFSLALLTQSWNTLYQYLSVGGFVLLGLSLLFIKSPTGTKRSTISFIGSLKSVFSNKQIILCSLAAAFSFGVLLAYAGLWYQQIETHYAISNLQSVIVSGIIFVGIGIGTPLLGWYSNVMQSRKMVAHTSLCIGVMVLLIGIYLPRYEVNTLLITQTISFLIGFTLSGSMLFYTIVSELATDDTRGVAISLLNTAVFLFNTVMLFLPYLFITSTADVYYVHLWVLPFFIMLAILILYFMRETYPSDV